MLRIIIAWAALFLGITFSIALLLIEIRARRRLTRLRKLDRHLASESSEENVAPLLSAAALDRSSLSGQPAASLLPGTTTIAAAAMSALKDLHKECVPSVSGSAPLAPRTINRAARTMFAYQRHDGIQVDLQADGVPHFLDPSGVELEVYSRADVDGLCRDLVAHPRSCIVNHEAFAALTASGQLAQLHEAGVLIYPNVPHHAVVAYISEHVSGVAAQAAGHHGNLLPAFHHVDLGALSRLIGTVQALWGGKATIHEAGVDAAVDGGFAIAGTGMMMGFGYVLGNMMVPGVGGVIGAYAGKVLARPAAELLKREIKYSEIIAHLNAVGRGAHGCLHSDIHMMNAVTRRLGEECFGRGEAESFVIEARAAATLYEAELYVYASKRHYREPSREGARARHRQRLAERALARVDRVADKVLSRLIRQCTPTRETGDDGYGRFGEVVCAHPQVFSPVLSPVDAARYRELFGKYPNHPLRLRYNQGGDTIAVELAFGLFCAEIDGETNTPELPMPPVPGQGFHRFAACAALALILGGLTAYYQPALAAWAGWSAGQPDRDGAAKHPVMEPVQDPEAIAFASLTGQEHLAAAVAAMSDGYDRRSKRGGNLDLAERHLHAINAGGREARRIKDLLAEIRDRRRRAASHAARSAPAVAAGVAGSGTASGAKANTQALEARLARAAHLLRRHRIGDAEAIFKDLQDHGVDDPRILAGLGQCALDRGQFDEALERFSDALGQRDSLPEALLGTAEVYRHKGETVHAVEWYQNYLKQRPHGRDAERARTFLANAGNADPVE